MRVKENVIHFIEVRQSFKLENVKAKVLAIQAIISLNDNPMPSVRRRHKPATFLYLVKHKFCKPSEASYLKSSYGENGDRRGSLTIKLNGMNARWLHTPPQI